MSGGVIEVFPQDSWGKFLVSRASLHGWADPVESSEAGASGGSTSRIFCGRFRVCREPSSGIRPRRALQVSYWKVAALMAFGAFPSGPLQLSRRNATFFIKYLGGGCSCIRVLGEQFPPARGVSDSPIYSFGRTILPDMGGKRFPNLQFS